MMHYQNSARLAAAVESGVREQAGMVKAAKKHTFEAGSVTTDRCHTTNYKGLTNAVAASA